MTEDAHFPAYGAQTVHMPFGEVYTSLQDYFKSTAPPLDVEAHNRCCLGASLSRIGRGVPFGANKARLCEADMACIVRPDDGKFFFAANYRFPKAFVDLVTGSPVSGGRGTMAGRVLLEGGPIHIPDVLADHEYQFGEGQKLAGFQTLLGVPLTREGVPIGVIVLARSVVRPFADKQIELVNTFADQAVIAIENARLFEAEQQRTRELCESLEQQTATSQVLQVMSSSPGELAPVFQAMLENASRLCQASYGTMWLHESDGQMRVAARHGNLPEAFRDKWHVGRVFRPESFCARRSRIT